jgi:hypothetical protein
MGETSKIEWRDIPSCVGFRASSDGTIYTAWKRVGREHGRGTKMVLSDSWRPLKNHIDANGYLFTILGRGKRAPTHRLVLLAFSGPCPEGQEGRHLDGNPANCALDNLKWGTPVENHADQYRLGTRVCGERHPQAKLSASQVGQIRTMYATGKYKQYEIAEVFGVTQSVVSMIVNRKHRVTAISEGGII